MNHAPCPRCGGSVTVIGKIVQPGSETDTEINRDYTPFQEPVRACLGCGLCWTEVDPVANLAAMAQQSPLLRQIVDRLLHGSLGGLPDTEWGRRLAAEVAEIDDLVFRGRPNIAMRRYRQLTGKTWDRALIEMDDWRKISRDEKLARFGWKPKKPPTDDLGELL